MEILTELNWLAIVVGTIFYCAFGGIWHRQFAFGKKWEEAMGFERPKDWKETNIYYVVPLIACLITTVVIAILLNLTNTSSYNDALKLGLLIGFGIAMAVVFTASVIPIMKKPLAFGAITGTAQALGITLTTMIIYAITN